MVYWGHFCESPICLDPDEKLIKQTVGRARPTARGTSSRPGRTGRTAGVLHAQSMAILDTTRHA